MRMTFETQRRNVGPGWQPLIENLHAELTSRLGMYEVHQIKEKFGGLRYYTDVRYDSPEGKLIEQAEAASYGICEQCGTTEDVSTGGQRYVLTLCPKCREAK